jgi:hypothetical protein
MRLFWWVLLIGAVLVLLSSLWSLLGTLASERSDVGVIAGALTGLVVVGALAAVVEKLLKRRKR